MEKIEVKRIIQGVFFTERETIATFKSDELQLALDFIEKHYGDEDYMYEVHQEDDEGSLIWVGADELIHDRKNGEIYHDLSAY